MKNKTFKICSYISTGLFFGFLSLYAYTLLASPNPWKSYITIGNSNPVVVIDSDSPSKRTLNLYPHIVHATVEKNDVEDMQGCHILFFNQNMPYELNASFAFTPNDKNISKFGFMNYGIKSGSWTHSTRMIGCATNDQTSEDIFLGYGIFFWKMSHTINQEQNWWTFFFSLWYPIVIFAILPTIFLIKKFVSKKRKS